VAVCPATDPRTLDPLDEVAELIIISAAIKELNELFTLDLDADVDTWRQKEPEDGDTSTVLDQHESGVVRYVVVGASHATRLAKALTEAGECVSCLASPGWKLNAESVAATSTALKHELEKDWAGETIIVYQMYDSSVYFSSSRPGEMALPKKNKEDGIFHVVGRLKMADHDSFKEVVTDSIPLLRAGGGNIKIVLSPLPRYIMGPCCSNPDHVTNHGGSKYAEEMGARLADMCEWQEDFLYFKRIKKVKTLFPGSLIGDMKEGRKELAASWGRDPVHMTVHGYNKEADGIRKLTPTLLAEFAEAKETTGHQEDSTRDRSLNRQRWVSRSDATAPRNYTDRRGPSDDRNPGGGGFGSSRGGGGWSRGWQNRGRGNGGWRGHKFNKPY